LLPQSSPHWILTILFLFCFELSPVSFPLTGRRGLFCGQVTPRRPQVQGPVCRTSRAFFQVLIGVRVGKTFLSDRWTLQIPLPVGLALSLFTVPGGPGWKGKMEMAPSSIPRQDCNATYTTYWSMKQECERKTEIFQIQ